MALSISLKPREKLFIGGAVIQNGPLRAEMTVLNDVPILRQKEILHEQDANTPCRRIYLAVQQMYMDTANRATYYKLLGELMQDVARAAPSTVQHLADIGELVNAGEYYSALKRVKELINYEMELLKNAG